MKILKQTRFSRPIGVQLALLLFLSLGIAGGWMVLWDSSSFRHAVAHEWWPWGLPCLMVLWLLWLIVDTGILAATKDRFMELVDFRIRESQENIIIRFRLIHFSDNPVALNRITAKFHPLLSNGIGGFPNKFKAQRVVYDSASDLYEVNVEKVNSVDNLGRIYLYVASGGIIPYHCIYKVYHYDKSQLIQRYQNS